MNEYGKYNDEMSLEELEQITAGYPDLSALSDMKESEQLKETAEVTEESGIVAGFTGPYNMKSNCTVLFDVSLKGLESMVCGANETDYHYKGFNIARDLGEVEYVDLSDGDKVLFSKSPVLNFARIDSAE